MISLGVGRLQGNEGEAGDGIATNRDREDGLSRVYHYHHGMLPPCIPLSSYSAMQRAMEILCE